MNKRPSKSASAIRSLTSFIDNNRQEIKSTLILSSIMTAGIMVMFAFHPALMSVWAYIAAGFETMMLGFTFAIENTAHVIYEAAALLWAGIAKAAAYLYASTLILVSVFEEWKETTSQFLSLPLVEMADIIIRTLGYFWTTVVVFIVCTYMIVVFLASFRVGFRMTLAIIEHPIRKPVELNELNRIFKSLIGTTILEELEQRNTRRRNNSFSESELSRTPDGVTKYKNKTSK